MRKSCRKTFINPLKGVIIGKSLTCQERAVIIGELNSGDTFERVAEWHRISKTKTIKIFDDAYVEAPRHESSKFLLIDEFKLTTPYSKYCCHLVDFERSETIDVLGSR